MGVVRSAWCGGCDLYPLSKCGLIRLHYPPPVQPYIACYFHVPEPFLREHLFFYKSRIYVVSRMSAWVTFFSTWSVEWPSKKSGTNWQRTQPTPARNSPFFYSPNLKSCQTSDFLDYIKPYARSKRTQPTPARKSPFFLYSPNLSVFWIILYQTRCQVKADAKNPARNSLFSFRGSLLFPPKSCTN